MRSNTAEVLALLRSKQSFVLTTHVNPDGDGLGSELALAAWLSSQGKSVHIINPGITPGMYLFLDGERQIHYYNGKSDAGIIAQAEAIIVLDTNHPDRLLLMKQPVLSSPAAKVCIDHHLDPAPFAQYYIIDDDATSTGEIIYYLLNELTDQHLSPTIAAALYCAIMTDTGSFRYPRVDPEIHRIVADLIECGADPIAIYANVYERWSVGRMKLLGVALSGMSTEYDGTLAHMSVTRSMLVETGTSVEDTDNFTTYLMSVEGVTIGILFVELAEGVKISFRSKGEIPINKLAQQFGGNGHKNAAGARVHGETLTPLKNSVLRAASAFLTTPSLNPKDLPL